MNRILLRPNAAPVYRFLSVIFHRHLSSERVNGIKILDCGAGGAVPPLAVFARSGFDCWGIDISLKQLQRARQYSQEKEIDLHLQKGDMRELPFAAESFQYAYEHFSLCHLSKADTAWTIREMKRVLKPGGLCFWGVISADTWPKSIFGEEKDPGEYWGEEGGKLTLHSLFTDAEADQLASGWEVVDRQKQIRTLIRAAEETSRAGWKALYQESEKEISKEKWENHYENRRNDFRYVHLYYTLRKSENQGKDIQSSNLPGKSTPG